VKARVTWAGDMTFVAESGSGHALVLDASPDVDGRDLGFRPMEMLLAGTGGCTAIDVMLILRKMRQEVTDCVVELEADRAETDPKVFTAIRMRYVVTGRGLDPAKVERAVRLSAETYCSATAMMAKTAAVTHEVEIREG
jgi:putative redox protein